jgi:aminomethyltransferase
VVANAGNRAAVAAELVTRCAAFDCEVFDESDDIALIAIQGPKALEILSQVWSADSGSALDAPDGSGPALDVPGLADLGYYRCAPGTFGDHELLVARTGYTGEDGYELYLAPDAAPALWTALLETGAGSGLIPCGLAARDTLRLEAGMPLYGHELSLETQPAQAGLGRTVPLKTKTADFVGREALLEASPPTKKLVGLTTEGRRAGRAGYPVFVAAAEGAEPPAVPVGEITSGALSPTLGYPIAMAYVDVDAIDAGDPLTIDVRGTRITASVVPLPFYTREKTS